MAQSVINGDEVNPFDAAIPVTAMKPKYQPYGAYGLNTFDRIYHEAEEAGEDRRHRPRWVPSIGMEVTDRETQPMQRTRKIHN